MNASVKGTNTPTWECIGTVTWVYTNKLTRELNRYRPDQTGPDQTDRPDRQTHFKSFLSLRWAPINFVIMEVLDADLGNTILVKLKLWELDSI